MRTWLLLCPLLLSGCATTASDHPPRFLHQVPAGTLLSLERPLQFRAGVLRVYFQDGQIHRGFGFFGSDGINRYRAYCALELQQKPDADLELTPREFRLAHVTWDVTYVMNDTSEFRTQWRLDGSDEPQAYAFVCYKNANAAHEPPLSLEEIDQVVGDYFRLKDTTPQ
jgi:hypothetical protein